MKYLLNILNHHSSLRNLVFNILVGISRITGVSAQIVNRAKQINMEKQAEYSLGLLIWFIAFKLRLPIPDYNIYHLIKSEDQSIIADNLLRPCLDNYRIAKQYYLLKGTSTDDEDFKLYIQQLVQEKVTGTGQTISQKPGLLNTDKAFSCLCDTIEILKKNDIKSFLISGTLLGFIRDGHLLEHDNDLDIGLFAEEASTEDIVNLLRQDKSFMAVYDLGHMVQATHKNGTVIDIFLHYRDKNRIWHGTDIHRWYNTPFKLVEREFTGSMFLVPDPPEQYLDENYGNWHSQTLFWDYSFDTPNQDFADTKKTVFFLVERILEEIQRSHPDRYSIENCIHALSKQFNFDLNQSFLNMKDSIPITTVGKTVITFGTFDLLHIGHINILKRAASLGNKLIVGVSSDELNYSKKNAYPVYREDDRMRIVESIECVDEVFLEESLELKEHYIKKHNADVLVMGDDWEGKFDYMSKICEVVYLPRTANISTSETKDSIRINL